MRGLTHSLATLMLVALLSLSLMSARAEPISTCAISGDLVGNGDPAEVYAALCGLARESPTGAVAPAEQ